MTTQPTSRTFSAQPTTMEEVPQFLREQITGIANSIFLAEAGIAMQRGGQEAFEYHMEGGVIINASVLHSLTNSYYTFDILTRGTGHSLTFPWPR